MLELLNQMDGFTKDLNIKVSANPPFFSAIYFGISSYGFFWFACFFLFSHLGNFSSWSTNVMALENPENLLMGRVDKIMVEHIVLKYLLVKF